MSWKNAYHVFVRFHLPWSDVGRVHSCITSQASSIFSNFLFITTSTPVLFCLSWISQIVDYGSNDIITKGNLICQRNNGSDFTFAYWWLTYYAAIAGGKWIWQSSRCQICLHASAIARCTMDYQVHPSTFYNFLKGTQTTIWLVCNRKLR